MPNCWERLEFMTLTGYINLISVFLIGVFLLPVAAGIVRPLTSERIYSSVNTAVNIVLITMSAALAVCFAEYLYSNGGNNLLGNIFRGIPAVWYSIVSQDVLVYIMIILILLIGLNGVFQLLLIPFSKKVMFPLSARLGGFVGSMNRILARLIGGLWQLPKSVYLVLVFTLLFNIYTLLSNNSSLDDYINESQAYRLIDDAAVRPIMSSEAAQRLPGFVNSTVDKAMQCLSPEGRKLLIKVYINGVTVEDAVKSSPEIDNAAIGLVGAETDRYLMAEALYAWVAENISYDREKAEELETDSFAAPSGAVPAFSEKTGVCFDKACLYVAMCRTVGVRVRLVTGKACNGIDWLDHSWNQIYDDRDNRWVNVDTTFGNENKNYFDNTGFFDDHREAEIQGEW